MNQSQSPTSLDLAPSLSKRRGKGTIGSQTHETSLVPAARTRQIQFLIKVQLRRTLIPLPAPYPRAPSLALRAIHLVAAQPPLPCKGERGIAKSFYGTFGVYRGDSVPPILWKRLVARAGSARYDRWHRPQAATGAPRRRCGSCPTDCPADDGCPMRSSRSSPVRLPESASCR